MIYVRIIIGTAIDSMVFIVFYVVFCHVGLSVYRSGHVGSDWCCYCIYKLVVSLLSLLPESSVIDLKAECLSITYMIMSP